MAIKETELVTLNGNTTAFGGRIYNVNYQVGFNQSPSSVNLSIINENGIYNISEDDMSVLGSPDTISFGGRELKMFPIGYSKDNSDGGKILTVKYLDPSVFYLDKKYVILWKTHSETKTNNPNQALMVLGDKYYSVEEENEDGNYVQSFSLEPPNDFDLGKSLYTLEELYNTMVQHKIPMDSSVRNILLNKNGATDYLNNITGTLRSVLLAWANLMAFAFYWGEDNKLHLIDLESNINVDLDKLNGIIPFTDEESFSLEETVDRGFSLYYGKEGSAQTSSEIGTSKTSFYFQRGIQDYNSSTELSYAAQNKLQMIKAAAISESFFRAYSLYIAIENAPTYDGLFGVRDVRPAVSNVAGKNINTMFAHVTEDQGNRYPQSDYNLVEYVETETQYSFGFFENIINRLLTYEFAMRESDREGFNSWSIQFNYDYDDETTFINSNNGAISGGDDPKHRAYFTASKEWAFDFSALGDYDEEPLVPIDFTNKSKAETEGFDIENKTYVLIKKGINWENVRDIKYRRKNKQSLKVDGFNVKGGAFNSITPRLEHIYLKSPSLNSNTISTDMQIETGNELEISLAGRSFENLADLLNESYLRDSKTFRKTFSITGITLPQNINPEDGLQSISISNTNDKGTTSTYAVGNSFFRVPSKDIIIQRLEREKYAELKSRNNFTFIFNAGGFNV